MAYIFKKSEEDNQYLYTKGKQYILNRKEYVGEYHIQNGIAFTGPTHTKTSVKLFPFSISLDVYDYNMLKPDIDYGLYTLPYTCVIEPMQGQYNIGFFIRYFVRKRNEPNSPIYEIDQDLLKNYGKTSGIDANLYQKTDMRWDISNKEDTPVRITKLNTKNARLANVEMLGLYSYISNFFEFSSIKLKVNLNP